MFLNDILVGIMIQSCLGFFSYDFSCSVIPSRMLLCLVAVSLRLLLAVVLPLTCLVSDNTGQAFCRMSLLACLMFFLWLDMDYGNKTTKVKTLRLSHHRKGTHYQHDLLLLAVLSHRAQTGLPDFFILTSLYSFLHIVSLGKGSLKSKEKTDFSKLFSDLHTHIHNTHTMTNMCTHTHTQWHMCTHTHTHIWTNK